MGFDIKCAITLFLGVWTLALMCIVIGMYSTWESKILNEDNNNGRNQETTEPLGKEF